MDLSQEAGANRADESAVAGTGMVLLTLASAQFLMTLDSSVMNCRSRRWPKTWAPR